MFGDWLKELTIKKKITAFAGFVFLIIFIAVFLAIVTMKFSLFDFRAILDENDVANQVAICLKEEAEAFETYIKNEKAENRQYLSQAVENTQKAIGRLPKDYSKISQERFARTQALVRAYCVYSDDRDELLTADASGVRDVDRLYRIYDMQRYLMQYADKLMNMTIAEGNETYQKKTPVFQAIPYVTALTGIVLLGIVIYWLHSLNRTIVVPLLSLAEAARKIADNDFYIDDVEVVNEDELGELIHAFNKMKYATGEYISALEGQRETLDLLHARELEQLEMEKQLDAIRLEALKSQIQPHFLFNTLNVIAGMADLEDAHTTEKMIQALSNLFRYNLKTTEGIIPLAKEIKVLDDYMYLQQMRFGARISYSLKCEVNKDAVMVPPFIFQPLAENAIIHGLAPKEVGGELIVHIRRDLGSLFISVKDTGVGMDEKKLEELLTSLTSKDTDARGIGLKNVYERIKNTYHDSDFRIFSKAGTGTEIQMRIAFSETEMISV